MSNFANSTLAFFEFFAVAENKFFAVAENPLDNISREGFVIIHKLSEELYLLWDERGDVVATRDALILFRDAPECRVFFEKTALLEEQVHNFLGELEAELPH